MTPDQAYAWQQSRRRGTAHAFPVSGFGPGGAVTLWVADPAPPRARLRFVGGRPVVDAAPAAAAGKPARDPLPADLQALRDRVIATFARRGPDRLRVGVVFFEYAAALLAHSYALTDDELGWLMGNGVDGDAPWYEGVVQHVCGGPRFVEVMERAEASALLDAFPAAPPAPAVRYAPEPWTAAGRRPWWARAWARVAGAVGGGGGR